MSADAEVVLVGGGHAHVQVLRGWCRAPPPRARITLVTPAAQFLYSGMIPGLVAGHYTVADCTIELLPLSRRLGASLRLATATELDAAGRRVICLDRSGSAFALPYDVLSVDVGGVVDVHAIAGARQHALSVRPLDAFVVALGIRLAAGAAAPSDAVVLGGGAAGFELALALRFRLPAARVSLVAGAAGLLGDHAPAARRLASAALRRRGVAVHADEAVAVAARDLTLRTGACLPSALTLLATGTTAPPWLRGSGLALDPSGFIATGPTLQSVSHPEVFAGGDVAAPVGAALARNGVYAVRSGAVLARNLRHALEGGALAAFRPQRRTLSLLSCGDGSAIASWGRWALEGRALWWLKDRIDRGFVARDDACSRL